MCFHHGKISLFGGADSRSDMFKSYLDLNFLNFSNKYLELPIQSLESDFI